MNKTHLTAASLLRPARGIFVADEYVEALLARPRGSAAGTTLARYVELVLATPGVDHWLSGIVLTQDTLDECRPVLTPRTGMDELRSLQVGVRMDPGLTRLDADMGSGGGLETARQQLKANHDGGVTFTEWRANLSPADVQHGQAHIDAAALARGAAAAQAEDVLPLITVAMPDLASHSVNVTRAVTTNALTSLFEQLARSDVDTSAVLLRMNMVVPGDRHPVQGKANDVATATLDVISQVVPRDVPGVVFLSGGRPVDQVVANLAAIRELAQQQGEPWKFTFAFARPLVPVDVEDWGPDSDQAAQQKALLASWQAIMRPMSPAGASG